MAPEVRRARSAAGAWSRSRSRRLRGPGQRRGGPPGSRDRAWNHDGIDYPERFVRWTAKSNLETLLHLQSTGAVRAAPLITHRFPIDRAGEAADLLIDHPDQSLGVLLTYGSEGGSQ